MHVKLTAEEHWGTAACRSLFSTQRSLQFNPLYSMLYITNFKNTCIFRYLFILKALCRKKKDLFHLLVRSTLGAKTG